MRKQFETLGLHRLNDVNDVVAFPEIGQELSDKLLNDCNLKWQATLDRETSNKLRFYRLLKTEFISEPYLEMPISRKERKALAKVRCGVAPLRLEMGLWEKRNNIQIPHEERVCLNCFKNGFIETENEEHFLLRCLHPDLKVLRENLLRKACTVLPSDRRAEKNLKTLVRVMAADSITVRNGLVVNKINDPTASRSTNRSVSSNHSSSINRTASHRHSQRQSV